MYGPASCAVWAVSCECGRFVTCGPLLVMCGLYLQMWPRVLRHVARLVPDDHTAGRVHLVPGFVWTGELLFVINVCVALIIAFVMYVWHWQLLLTCHVCVALAITFNWNKELLLSLQAGEHLLCTYGTHTCCPVEYRTT